MEHNEEKRLSPKGLGEAFQSKLQFCIPKKAIQGKALLVPDEKRQRNVQPDWLGRSLAASSAIFGT